MRGKLVGWSGSVFRETGTKNLDVIPFGNSNSYRFSILAWKGTQAWSNLANKCYGLKEKKDAHMYVYIINCG